MNQPSVGIHDINALVEYTRLNEQYSRLKQLIEDVNAINGLLYSGKYVLIVYPPRKDDFVEFYTVNEDDIKSTHYIKSSRTLPLTANMILIKDDSLVAVNKYTGIATKIEGRVELCQTTLIPTDKVFYGRIKQLTDIVKSSANGSLSDLEMGDKH